MMLFTSLLLSGRLYSWLLESGKVDRSVLDGSQHSGNFWRLAVWPVLEKSPGAAVYGALARIFVASML